LSATIVWGLKRSGIHLIVGWLYANLGATVKDDLGATELPRQLQDGFRDPAAGVAYFNNCGWLYSRQLGLGPLTGADLLQAAARQRTTVFGVEDCSLRWATTTAAVPDQRNVILLRDPLNNLASRLEGTRTMPGQLRTDDAFLDVFEEYCAEVLGHTEHLADRTIIIFNRFIGDRAHRDELAAALGLAPGPSLGRLLAEVEAAAFAGEIHTREEAIAHARRALKADQAASWRQSERDAT
jgi:hypothetical protein